MPINTACSYIYIYEKWDCFHSLLPITWYLELFLSFPWLKFVTKVSYDPFLHLRRFFAGNFAFLHWFIAVFFFLREFLVVLAYCCKFFFSSSLSFASLFIMPRQNQPDTESVFYVHPSEGPNCVLVTSLLDGSNYLTWSRSMIRAFGAKNKLKFVDGSMEIPYEDDLNRNAWERWNNHWNEDDLNRNAWERWNNHWISDVFNSVVY